jgi:hypothetical protein
MISYWLRRLLVFRQENGPGKSTDSVRVPFELSVRCGVCSPPKVTLVEFLFLVKRTPGKILNDLRKRRGMTNSFERAIS